MWVHPPYDGHGASGHTPSSQVVAVCGGVSGSWICGLGCPHACVKGPSQVKAELGARERMEVSWGPGTILPRPPVLVWNPNDCENSEFTLGFPVILQVYLSSRMTKHLLFNNLLDGFITSSYLDMWAMGLYWSLALGPTNVNREPRLLPLLNLCG